MAVKAPQSLRRRLIAAAILWLALALAASGVVLRLAFEDSVERTFQLRLLTAVRSLAAAIDVDTDGKFRLARPLGDSRFDQPFSGWYWQVAEDHTVLLRSRSLWDTSLPVLPPPEEAGGAVFGRTPGPDGQSLLTAERDLTFPDHDGTVHVAVAADRHDIDRELARFDRVLAGSFVLLALGLAAAMAIQVGYGLKPLKRLTADLAGLRRHPGQRLCGPYPSEIAPLAQALNSVLDHDAELVERARTHVGNLAHGLKTPLSVMTAEISSPHADTRIIRQQIDQMRRLVEHHLTRARAEASSSRALGAQVLVTEVVGEITAVLTKIHAGRGLTLENTCDSDARFAGDREDLAEMLGNLMDNACKWGHSRVRIGAVMNQGQLCLDIEDDGPGLTTSQCEEVMGRGIRLDESAPGHGLGLDIVRDLAGLYGGRLNLEPSPLGGLRARLTFTPSHSPH